MNYQDILDRRKHLHDLSVEITKAQSQEYKRLSDELQKDCCGIGHLFGRGNLFIGDIDLCVICGARK